jgi:hypothetical protein
VDFPGITGAKFTISGRTAETGKITGQVFTGSKQVIRQLYTKYRPYTQGLYEKEREREPLAPMTRMCILQSKKNP